ncbi:MAG: MBL fold metallo-hydrolase [Clostridiaceae bacterium]|jgi:anaerobic nitric oxide reductase flavorubredoxin|nr:MBL fold metallo-hydrolase [Clostridiaceae bacterium]
MIQVKDQIYHLGLRDWELRNFHGHELSTFNGSSYNSYLIRDEKTVLVDTTWGPRSKQFMDILSKEVEIDNIDYIIINHAEPDHSGALVDILEKRPDIPIYCTAKGADIIKKQYHKEWNFRAVKTGDTLNIGQYELVFVEMTMIHWPDSMMTFVKGPNVLLSNDAFGQHFAGASIFEDENDECVVMQEAMKYYAGILTPMSALIKKKIDEVLTMNLPIEMIAPSHGSIWRKNPLRIVENYAKWSDNYDEGYVSIIYDTMYDATKKMADAISGGLESKGILCKQFNCSLSDMSDLITDIFKSKGIIVGSCTVNNGYLRSIAALIGEIKGLKFKNKVGAAFGSYGWSGEAHKKIHKELEEAGIKMVHEPIGIKYQPYEDELEACFQLGREFSAYIR